VRGEILPVENIPNYRPRDGLVPPAQTGDGGAERAIAGSKEGDKSKTELADRRDLQDYDLIVPNIELATGSGPQFLPGQPPTVLAQTLSTRIYTLLHSCDVIHIEDLRIWHHPQSTSSPEDGGDDDDPMVGADEDADSEDSRPRIAAYWTLYIDLLLLSHDGNIHDAAWAATLAALRATSLPRAHYDSDREAVICTRRDPLPLRIRGLPIACTAGVFLEKPGQEAQMRHGAGKSWVLVDPDAAEEELCEETATVVVDCSDGQTRIRRIEKNGGLCVDREVIKQMVQVAEIRWRTFRKVMV
jgi:exosome complex component RRP43